MSSIPMSMLGTSSHSQFASSSARPAQPTRTLSSQIIPHTIEAGDPYYIGDAYSQLRTPSRTSVRITTKIPSSKPYLAHILAVSKGWPHLRYLADFMTVTCAPPKLKLLTNKEREERAVRTRVSLVKFHEGKTTETRDYRDLDDLQRALQGNFEEGDDNHARFFIVEDLSRGVIETLGARFDIDPSFFRNHISDYMWYNLKDPWIELPSLEYAAVGRDHFTIRYVQTRYFENMDSAKMAQQQANNFNVLRRIDLDGIRSSQLDDPGSVIGVVRSKTSYWIRPNKKHQTGVFGILLVDPPITEGFPLWGGYNNFSCVPSINTSKIPTGPPRTSILADILYRVIESFSNIPSTIPVTSHIIAKTALIMICAEWLNTIEYATTRLNQLEYELDSTHAYLYRIKGLDNTLNKYHSWRRRLPNYHAMVSDTLDKVINRSQGSRESHSVVGDGPISHALRRDFELVLKKLEALQVRAESIASLVTSLISIEESQKAAQQNQSITRLTYLACTFVPLSFLSSLFSMTSDLGGLRGTFWVYFVIAVPLTVGCLLAVKYVYASQAVVGKVWSALGSGAKGRLQE